MATIGILGGMGPQATAQLYELIIEGTKTYRPTAVDDEYPEVVLLSVPVPNFISNKDSLNVARRMLVARTQQLEQLGSTINGIACNTAHILLPELQAATKVPFLSIPLLVARRVQAAGYRRVGLLATPTTLQTTLFDEALSGIAEIVRPENALAMSIEEYIYRQLNNSLTAGDSPAFRKLVQEFMEQTGVDAVILGCTELPLIYGDLTDAPHIIDTLQVLADALLRAYFLGPDAVLQENAYSENSPV